MGWSNILVGRDQFRVVGELPVRFDSSFTHPPEVLFTPDLRPRERLNVVVDGSDYTLVGVQVPRRSQPGQPRLPGPPPPVRRSAVDLSNRVESPSSSGPFNPRISTGGPPKDVERQLFTFLASGLRESEVDLVSQERRAALARSDQRIEAATKDRDRSRVADLLGQRDVLQRDFDDKMKSALEREPWDHARAPTLTRDELITLQLRDTARQRLKAKKAKMKPSLVMIGTALGLGDLNPHNGSTPWGRFSELKDSPSGVESMESQVLANDPWGPLRTLYRKGSTIYLQDADRASTPYERRYAWYLVPRDVLLERL